MEEVPEWGDTKAYGGDGHVGKPGFEPVHCLSTGHQDVRLHLSTDCSEYSKLAYRDRLRQDSQAIDNRHSSMQARVHLPLYGWSLRFAHFVESPCLFASRLRGNSIR